MNTVLLDPEFLHTVYKSRSKLLEHLNEQQPDVFQDGENFCCISGQNHGSEICGYGTTPETAVEEWHTQYQRTQNQADLSFEA